MTLDKAHSNLFLHVTFIDEQNCTHLSLKMPLNRISAAGDTGVTMMQCLLPKRLVNAYR